MRIARPLLILTLFLLAACSRERIEQPLSDPGFGITAIEVQAGQDEVDIPVYMKYTEPVKGIQFTLSWDATLGDVSQPIMTAKNPNFTVSNNQARDGRMKVLIFSMHGDALDLSDAHIFNVPVEITNSEATQFILSFEDVVFAGPNASSYEIPVTPADLMVVR